jgi:hypothetical protein
MESKSWAEGWPASQLSSFHLSQRAQHSLDWSGVQDWDMRPAGPIAQSQDQRRQCTAFKFQPGPAGPPGTMG